MGMQHLVNVESTPTARAPNQSLRFDPGNTTTRESPRGTPRDHLPSPKFTPIVFSFIVLPMSCQH